MSGGIKNRKDIVLGSWKDLIQPNEAPKGYSTAAQISKKLNRPHDTVRRHLKELRDKGEIDCIRSLSGEGVLVWFYKD